LQAVIEAGDQNQSPGAPDVPEGVLAAPRHAWRNRFLLEAGKREPDAKSGTHDRVFRRAVTDLIDTGRVRCPDDWFWPDTGQSPDMSGQ
jgi:hypothetical protein